MNISDYWKTVFDTLRDALIIVDPNGNILSVNTAAEKITGYSAKELIGNSCKILNCSACETNAHQGNGHWCPLFSKGKSNAKQCLIRHKEGHLIPMVKNAAILRDKNGRIVGAVENLSDISEILNQQEQILSLRKTFHLDDGYYGIIGQSPVMQRIFDLIDNVAQSDAPVMISGESGTGKELVAQAIHEASQRKDKPFIKVNCAALNENLLESELFGHVRGAYTGANRTRLGRFESAHEGTIFLDEIGDAPASIQVKLLRVLEERKIERVGDHQPIDIDVRVITATNKNLEDRIAQGLFRHDLFFRINVFPMTCPNLRERRDDIPLLIEHFIKINNQRSSKNIAGPSPQVMEKLLSYSYPGNVRELRNAIEYAYVLCSGSRIESEHLPPKILSVQSNTCEDHADMPESEREKLIRALETAHGNQSQAAKILGVSRVTVWQRMKKYGIRAQK